MLFALPLNILKKKTSFRENLKGEQGKKVGANFEYSSDKNNKFLTIKDIAKLNVI